MKRTFDLDLLRRECGARREVIARGLFASLHWNSEVAGPYSYGKTSYTNWVPHPIPQAPTCFLSAITPVQS